MAHWGDRGHTLLTHAPNGNCPQQPVIDESAPGLIFSAVTDHQT